MPLKPSPHKLVLYINENLWRIIMKAYNSVIPIILIILSPIFLFSACREEPELISVSSKSRVWLGVQLKDVSKKMLKNLDLDSGVKIVKVFKDSPAEKAGLEEDDILVSFNGEIFNNTDELVDLVRDCISGDKVEITYLRAGEKFRTVVTIDETTEHASGYIFKRKLPKDYLIHHQGHTWLGVSTENLSKQLRDYFAAPDDQGILITNVFEESPAHTAGLRAGDVIIKVADKKIKNTYDLMRAINYFDPDDVVKIIIIREKKELFLEVKLGKKNKLDNYYRYGFLPEEIKIEMPEIDIEIPEIEMELNIGEFELLQEKLEEDLKIKSEQLQNKLKALDDKLKHMRIEIKNWDSRVI